MFTGIIEEKGKIKRVEHKKNLIVLEVNVDKVLRGTKIGDSIAVDGVCLTVSGRRNRSFIFDAMQETILKTTLKYLRPGDRVNLERALRVGDRLDGHFVFGHVDGVGTIKKKITRANYVRYDICVDKKLTRYIVPKGSIAVDGISLTVGDVGKHVFSIHIIPHTLKITALGDKGMSDKVNIETDILAKYIQKSK